MQAEIRDARVTGVILAAGSSVRMGRAKQLLRVGERCLLEYVLDAALGSRLGEVVVVLGAHAQEVRERVAGLRDTRVRTLVNEAHADGISTSLRCGIAACEPRADAVAILLADQPLVTVELIDCMLAAHAQSTRPIVRPLFGATRGERVPGHPVVIGRSAWTLLDTLAGDEGLRAVIAASPDLVENVLVAGEAPDDVDTDDDYRRLRERLGGAAVEWSEVSDPRRRARGTDGAR